MEPSRRTSASFFVGIDLGTGSCKSVVVDENGRVLGFGSVAYGGVEALNRWQEQDPRDLMKAAVASVRRAVRQAGDSRIRCGGMSIGGALHSVMAVDGRNEGLTGVIDRNQSLARFSR